MKTYSSVLPAATRKPGEQRDLFTPHNIKRALAEVFTNGFWYCDSHEGRCERVEGEHGQPAHCDVCGSPRVVWNPPIWTAEIGKAAA